MCGPCVNPEHLFLGTHAENMKDMKEKGRSPHGDEHSRSKLTAKTVSRIKAMLAQRHMRVSEIARAFDVTHATIDCIAKGKTWRHVKAAEPAPSQAEGSGNSTSSADDEPS